ncbi:DUF4931 domain-containing protein [Candidatus Bathyarchaeota archaeon]|nr:DUF4931 domain-containing protein [Candidatus Bathyarchaeota archaeon]
MPHNELRKDYLLDRWVVIATERGMRPSDFTKKKRKKQKKMVCPLCPGNEQMTPPAILVYKSENGKLTKHKDQNGFRHKNWLIRCIPNLYPAFSPPTQHSQVKQIIKNNQLGLAIGHHEVLIETPKHNNQPSDMKVTQLVLIIKAYIDRTRELTNKPYVKHVSIFRNYGPESGASLFHPHSQIIGMPITPEIFKAELKASEIFYDQNKKCIFCEILQKEKKGPRCVLENPEFLVFTPYASVNPLEFWIIPKKHSPNILNLSEKEIRALAETLKRSLSGLKQLVHDPPYNFGFHLVKNENYSHYHWHLEVYPKLSVWGGFEKSTGMFINTVMPETAASEMRKIIST